MRHAILKIDYPGDTQVRVHSGRSVEPFFIISGADIDDLDKEKVSEYLSGCDWCDRMSPAYVIPTLRPDEFMKEK